MVPLDLHLRALGETLSARIAAGVRPQGVTGAQAALLRVMFDTGPAPPGVLAARLGVTRGAVTRLADQLRAKRLVVRARSGSADRRSQTLALTGAGALLVPGLQAIAQEQTAALLDPLSPDARAHLAELLGRLAV